MQPSELHRGSSIIGIALSGLFAAVVFVHQFMTAFGCSGDWFGCSLMPYVSGAAYIAIGILALIFIVGAVTGRGTGARPALISLGVIAVVWALLQTGLMSGFFGKALSGTETKCVLLSGFVQSECVQDLALERNDPAVCDMLKDNLYDFGQCIKELAVRADDPSQCLGWDYRCVTDIAEARQDYALCEQMPQGTGRVGCYGSVAYAKNDLTVCSDIDMVLSGFCSEMQRSVKYEPHKYATADSVTFVSENLVTQLRAGQTKVDLVRIVASVTEGIAAIDGADFLMDKASFSDTFKNGAVYQVGANGRRIQVGAIFERDVPAERPSRAKAYFGPAIVSPGKPITLVISADVSADASGQSKLMFKGATALGSTTVQIRSEGTDLMKIE